MKTRTSTARTILAAAVCTLVTVGETTLAVPAFSTLKGELSGPTQIYEGQTALYHFSAEILNNDGNDFLHGVDMTFSAPGSVEDSSVQSIPDGPVSANLSASFTYQQNGTFSYHIGGEVIVCEDTGPNFFRHAFYNFNEEVPAANRTIEVLNVAPQLQTFETKSGTIGEGQSVALLWGAADPGVYDDVSFFLNGVAIGIDETDTTGLRYLSTNSPVFLDEGIFDLVGQVQDSDGAFSEAISLKLQVVNIDPSLTFISEDLSILPGTTFSFEAVATDPGIKDAFTYAWDFDGDGLFNDYFGANGSFLYTLPGVYNPTVQVRDGDGGITTGSFTVAVGNGQSNSVPDGGSALVMLSLALVAAEGLRRKLPGSGAIYSSLPFSSHSNSPARTRCAIL